MEEQDLLLAQDDDDVVVRENSNTLNARRMDANDAKVDVEVDVDVGRDDDEQQHLHLARRILILLPLPTHHPHLVPWNNLEPDDPVPRTDNTRAYLVVHVDTGCSESHGGTVGVGVGVGCCGGDECVMR